MRYRALGESGIEASVVGLGTWAIGGWMWGGKDDASAVRAIHAALDAGINLIDTAPAYGFGHSEEVIGQAIHDRRERVVLASKCGLIWDRQVGQLFFTSDEQGPTDHNPTRQVYRYLHPESIRREIEQSLRRLRTDHIDLYQTHWQDPTTPIDETMDCLMQLKQQGKIGAIGVCNVNAEQLYDYAQAGCLAVDQEHYNLLHRDPEQDLLAICQNKRVAFLAYSSLCKGLLTGKIGPDRRFDSGDQRIDDPQFSIENRQRIADALTPLQAIADQHDITLAQLVIAWTVGQAGVTHVLCGARHSKQAIENAGAGDVILSDDEHKRIARAFVTQSAESVA